MKRCFVCKVSQPVCNFYRSKRNTSDNLSGKCKTCDVRQSVKRARERPLPEKLHKWARRRARALGRDFDITVADVVVPEVCPVLGIPLFESLKRMGDNSPTLDRMDSTKGYVRGNVCVISWRANRLKNNATLDEIKALIAYMRGEL